ncbi:hypothetical protein [Streptomyces sp. HNM0574]|uniref:hypothetical protein n=1 Tax=Streptomyces sp. HNM0574 TaxID=2714954 RepID=UPI00146A1D75|nr:hypothetical protein [Streptomyces sp. HNM0574]NLU70941.1 hypothetical protein [Streptomyces sp. HNM0574]
MTTPSTGLRLFAREKRVRLTTYEPNGEPVGGPSPIAVEGDRAYVRTYGRAKRNGRLDRYPEVEIAPASLGGTPTGAPMKARARRLHGEESRHAAMLLARKQPLLQGVAVPLGYALMLDSTVHYELRLVGE